MHRLTNPNIFLLEETVSKLGDLVESLVFLGGCATSLLITDNAAPPIRYTYDVDVLTEAANRTEYYRFVERLREKGFHEDSHEDAPICRWKNGALLLDCLQIEISDKVYLAICQVMKQAKPEFLQFSKDLNILLLFHTIKDLQVIL